MQCVVILLCLIRTLGKCLAIYCDLPRWVRGYVTGKKGGQLGVGQMIYRMPFGLLIFAVITIYPIGFRAL